MFGNIFSSTKFGSQFRKKLRLNARPSDFMPPFLPVQPSGSQCLGDHHLLAEVACTRYWHHERHQNFNGMEPPGIPHWLQRFDWLCGWAHGWADPSSFPRSVYCHPDALQGLLRFLESNYTQGDPNAFLVAGGEDTRLSQQDPYIIKRLKTFFQNIYYEAYDVAHVDVDVMPIGLTEFYLRGVEEDVRFAVRSQKEKQNLVLSAFGQFWPELNKTINDRSMALDFADRSSFVTCGPFERSEYWSQLAHHKFMLCPLGNGVQSPKMFEGFLTRCVPIMTDSIVARRLAAKGAPILIVDSWEQLSFDYLDEVYPNFKGMIDDFFDIASNLDDYWAFSFSN